MRNKIGLSIPQYYTMFINGNIDLASERKVCCPFHKEDTPSFVYSEERGTWRCYGKCKKGGDVVELHRVNYKLKSREEAEKSLLSILGKNTTTSNKTTLSDEFFAVNKDNLYLDTLYNLCLMHCDRLERWLEMDLVMSKYPVEYYYLEQLLKNWGVKFERRI